MPQLVKGGKYVFGWSRIGENGGIVIPAEAVKEYGLIPHKKVILISASKTSGGFIVARKSMLERSSLGSILKVNPDLNNFRIDEGKPLEFKKRIYCWVKIRENNMIVLGRQTLEAYGIKPGDNLLSGRGSYIGLAMVVKGPIVEYAKNHAEILTF
jgi:bifunctional DNA-binding transcriptional regulator/antitoxin component of YhaV-PrlF toxin-antitoxin module